MTENEKLDIILKKLNNIEGSIQRIEDNVRSIEDSVRSIEITLENKTNRNIKLIVEGHLNLNRKLDEALKTLQPNAMYL